MNNSEGEIMQKDSEIQSLRNEVRELQRKIASLKKTVDELNEKIEKPIDQKPSSIDSRSYQIFTQDSLDRDLSWNRLIRLVQNYDYGLTTEELAERWGK